MQDVSLRLTDVSKVFNKGKRHAVQAVKSLNLEVDRGEIVALLGSSGCGKTSTLRMIAGFEDVSSGAITLAGKKIHTLAPAQRGVAMAFEGYSLYPPLSVRENISFALKASRKPSAHIQNQVAEIAHLLDIEDILDKHPAALSGGQQQRASLGRALVRESDLHLLDEPMGQLEPQLRALLRVRIKHFIKERKLTTILVTHDQTEANALADRIAVMEDGELQQYATSETLRTHPANLFTGTFIGEPPMNVFDAVVSISNQNIKFKLSDTVCLEYAESQFTETLKHSLLSHETVHVGIRPHAIQLSDHGIPATVIANQWLGDQTHVAASIGNKSVVAVKHERSHVKKGEIIFIRAAAEDLHFFSSSDGRAIVPQESAT